MSIEAMKLALEAHHKNERHNSVAETNYWCNQYKLLAHQAIEALAKQEQGEPVAWRTYTGRGYYVIDLTLEEAQKNWPDKTHQPLYATPQQRTWVGLTNDEVNNFAAGCHLGKSVQGAIYEAEAKLKDKNA